MSSTQPGYELLPTPPDPASGTTSRSAGSPTASASGPSPWGYLAAWLGTLFLCLLHTFVVWVAMGGKAGMVGDWPILRGDHGIHFQHGLVARDFLRANGSPAGYDPSFMAGYPLSIVSDLSSTLSDLAIAAAGDRPAQGYKLHVFLTTASVPWILVLVLAIWRASPVATLIAMILAFAYFWTDFPYKYAMLGMTNYQASVPLGLLAVACLTAYCERGGFARWLGALAACTLVFLVHVTSPMLVAPSGLLAYLVAWIRSRREGRPWPISRHLGLWAMLPAILGLNAFWWLPGYFLASTKGASDFAFSHSSERVAVRLAQVFWNQWPVESFLLGLAPLGLIVLGRRRAVAAAGLGGFLLMGLGWGYLAGALRFLDPLQPGRQTYACYLASCLAGGIGLAEVFSRLRASRGGRLDIALAIPLALVAVRVFGPDLEETARERIFRPSPFLSSEPTAPLLWVVAGVKEHMKPGERLLFEETGLRVEGLGDPFDGVHVSPILPEKAGVEVLGGPYLHATVKANFTQFGEGKLFENPAWDREFFVRYARIYRPSAICCWSPRARAFCRDNPDLIRVVEEAGPLVLARVIGFEGAASRGTAEVEASPNRLLIRHAEAEPGGDGSVVLRYHSSPYLKANPPVELGEILLGDDPVPFLKIRPTAVPIAIEMALPMPFRRDRTGTGPRIGHGSDTDGKGNQVEKQ